MKRRTGVLATGAAAFLLAVAVATPAEAAESSGCLTSDDGARGYWEGTPQDPTLVDPLHLAVLDTKRDGRHPAIRFVTKNYIGSTTYWPWHHNYDGHPNWKDWYGRAQSNDGMLRWTVQVANFDGSTRRSLCTAEWQS
ncbi:hypothetical protein ACWEKM_31905 [Streptomyces sp. NPDC004752]